MRRDRSHLLDAVPLLIAAWLVWALASVWAARIPHPYDLEWMEGGMLAHAWRLQHGRPLYVEPGPEFVPFIYPPGYPAVLAALSGLFGLSHALGRAVSLVSTFAAAGAIGFVVGRQGRSWALGLLGGVVFLGCYPQSGAFYDLVRNESLFVALLGWSVAMALERRRGALEAAGLLLAAAFLVKHNAALFGIPLAAGIATRDGWRPGLRFGLWAAVPAGFATLWLQWRTDGRFLTYLLAVPAGHPMVGGRLLPGTPWELGEALPVAVVATAAWFVWRTARAGGDLRLVVGAPVAAAVVAALVGFEIPADRAHPLAQLAAATGLGLEPVKGIGRFGPWVSMAALGSLAAAGVAAVIALVMPVRKGEVVLGVGLLATSFVAATLMRGHHGGFVNVHMQLHWAVALAFALALARARAWTPWAAPVGAALVSLQLGWSIAALEPAKLMPTAEDRATGDRVVAELRDVRGPVLSPYAPWLPVQAGHEPGLHLIALWDVADHDRTPFPDFRDDFEDALRGHHWGTIVDGTKTMGHGVNRHYERARRLPTEPGVFVPKTGWRTRPGALLVPRGAAVAPEPDDAG